MEKKFGLLRGLSNIYICEIVDTPGRYEQVDLAPQKLIPAGELKISKSIDKTQVFYDNVMYAEISKESPSEMELIGAAVRPAYIAWLEGKEVRESGAIIDDGDAHEKYFAICGQKDYTDGTSEFFWLLKCSYGGAEEATKTKDDSTDTAGITLPFTAYKTQYKFTTTGDGAKAVRIDTAHTKAKAMTPGGEAAVWHSAVITPDNVDGKYISITAEAEEE